MIPYFICHKNHLSAMQTEEVSAAIKDLEIQQRQYENLLDQSISNNEILAKVKIIYHDLKAVSDKLKELKKLQAGE
jgi:tRNA1(Val) A37 N6-methylase TrmN6